MAILGFHHVGLSTPDLDRLVAFYRDVIGFEPVFDMRWQAGTEVLDRLMAMSDTAARVVMLRTGNSFLEIFQFDSPEPARRPAGWCVADHGLNQICLAVDDLDAEHARLVARGMRFTVPPGAGMGAIRGTYGYDPDGNVIELLEISDPAFPLHFSNRRLAARAAAA